MTGRRTVAAFVDIVLVALSFFVTAELAGTADLGGADGNISIELHDTPAVLWAAGVFLYYFLTEALASQTLGKALLGLQVVRMADGAQPSPGRIAARNVLRVIDGLPFFYGLGMLVVLVSPQRQRIGDLAGRTVITRKAPPRG